MQRQTYLDHNATTPLADDVLAVYLSALQRAFGNASSVHQIGQAARQQVELARRQVAALLGVKSEEIVFTSGGTESDNLALFGAVRASQQSQPHLVTTAIEHPAVLNMASELERQGVSVTRVPVEPDGRVDPDRVKHALRPETVLVSVMHANSETGVVQPLAEIAAITRQVGVLLHSDGVQAVGKLAVSLPEIGVDLYSCSAHKLSAPKGVGALYVRKGVNLQPQQFGGRHEAGRRAGTENAAGVAAFGAACAWWSADGAAERERLTALRNHLEEAALARIPHSHVNGSHLHRLPNTTNLRIDGIQGEAMVIALDLRGFAVSSGSACSSGAVEPSHVLLAMSLSAEQARASIRVSLGRINTREEVDAFVDALVACAAHLRRVSPVRLAYA